MQLNPARGRKLVLKNQPAQYASESGLCSSTPRGDGNPTKYAQVETVKPMRFMQLNPARGRKLARKAVTQGDNNNGLCSSTPRGDGNLQHRPRSRLVLSRFMQLNPARGRKLQSSLEANVGPLAHAVYAAQPREGTETCSPRGPPSAGVRPGLCSSTPRGDGNKNVPTTYPTE